MEGYAIVRGPVPEALRRIVDMHDSYYGSRWGFGPAFTRKNVTELSGFLGRFNPDRDGLWTALGTRWGTEVLEQKLELDL